MTASSSFTRRPPKKWWQRNFLFLFVVVFWTCTLLTSWAFSMDPYTNWKIPGTDYSCCSNMDCAPADFRVGKNGYEAYMIDKWVEIPERIVLRDYHSPDGMGHLCARKDGTLLCFAPGHLG